MKELSIQELLEQESVDVKSLWYDWFCKDSSLQRKGQALLSKLRAISTSKKFDNSKCFVIFKNNCPLVGSLYDDFRICDIKTGEVIYCVTPKSGHKAHNGLGDVWGEENQFERPLFEGTWKEIKKWFLEE